MPADPEHLSHEDDPLDNTELVRRLRRMQWPSAPPEVKARVLRRIVAPDEESEGDGSASSPESAV